MEDIAGLSHVKAVGPNCDALIDFRDGRQVEDRSVITIVYIFEPEKLRLFVPAERQVRKPLQGFGSEVGGLAAGEDRCDDARKRRATLANFVPKKVRFLAPYPGSFSTTSGRMYSADSEPIEVTVDEVSEPLCMGFGSSRRLPQPRGTLLLHSPQSRYGPLMFLLGFGL